MKTSRFFVRAASFLTAAALLTAAAPLLPETAGTSVTAIAADENYTDGSNEQFMYRKFSDHIEIAFANANYDPDSLVIPDSIDGMPVTSIGIYAFQQCKMTSLTLPDTLTEIKPYAFGFCKNLKKLTMPDSLKKIGFHAFESCDSLETIEFPDHLVETGDFTFDETPWLAAQRKINPLVIVNNAVIDGRTCEGEVKIPSGVKYIASGAFSKNDKLTSVIVPASVTAIQENTFWQCANLTSAEIKGAESLGWGAFGYCDKLTDLKLSGKLKKIDDAAFVDNAASATITFYGSESTWNQVAKPQNDGFLQRARMVFDENHTDEPDGPVIGDINKDGACTVADAVLLQKWLLAIPNTELPDWKAGDMNGDEQLDARDLTMLKTVLLKG